MRSVALAGSHSAYDGRPVRSSILGVEGAFTSGQSLYQQSR